MLNTAINPQAQCLQLQRVCLPWRKSFLICHSAETALNEVTSRLKGKHVRRSPHSTSAAHYGGVYRGNYTQWSHRRPRIIPLFDRWYFWWCKHTHTGSYCYLQQPHEWHKVSIILCLQRLTHKSSLTTFISALHGEKWPITSHLKYLWFKGFTKKI